ncbi:hypothetical protein ACWEO4_43990 [Streptomyces sp. NPDC004393]|uniref:hypothetical protein n=1 Tax=Streptomyces sp. NPDC004533 TaxID=3154278 RepID=UPI0033A962A0
MPDADTGRIEIIHHPGDPQGSGLQMRVGDELSITLHGSSAYGWAPVEVVAGPLTVVETEAAGGSAHATVRATCPGKGELRSTSSFRGDRFGPQTRLWKLLVHITT